MELQFNKAPLRCLQRAVWDIQSEEQTQEYRLPDAMPDIGRVLASWGQVLIRGKEWRGGSMGVSGGVMVWVLYAPEDGGEPRSVETWLPFQCRWSLSDTERDGAIRVVPLLRSVDARTLSARKLMIRANLSVLGEAWAPYQAELYTPGELPPDVELLKRSYPMRVPKEAGEKAFTMEEELTLPASAPTPQKLISYQLQPELTDQKIMADKVVFRGSAVLHVVYQAEDGCLKNWDFEVSFSQYGELEREYDPNAAASILPLVTALELELAEDGHISMKAGIAGQYVICDREVLELVEDAYSPNRDVGIQMGKLELPLILDMRAQTVQAEQAMESDGSQVIDTAFYGTHPSLRRMGNAVSMELAGMWQVLYYDGNGSVQSVTPRWEEQMELPADQDTTINAWLQLTGRPQAAAGGGSLHCSADMLVDAVTTSEQGLPMATSLSLGELSEPDPARASLILRRAGSEGLWSLAKRTGSTVAAIRKANNLENEPDPERMLLIPIA